jgi:acyl-coenzyme A thioesterase PaaI-like protein
MKQASSRNCFVCGVENPYGLHLEFYETTPGEVMSEYTIPDHFQGYPGVAHGGIVATMLDEISGRSHIAADPPRFMFTARLEVRYRQNVPTGEPLRILGKAGKSKGRMATATAEIYNQNGALLAEADAILVDVPQEIIDNSDLDQLGWKVYPDEDRSEQ